MFRFLASALSSLSLIASGVFIWFSGIIPQRLPDSAAGWISTWFNLFHDPIFGFFIFLLVTAVVLGSWFITEIVLGLAYSILAGCLAFVCFLGFLSLHYPGLEETLVRLVK